mmetsp:Transcript_612/g.2240  ORF Transcript_612/g.2240 Transcript_612/m.2240 type:complete len:81 (-) Transcript_612:88-330(-)
MKRQHPRVGPARHWTDFALIWAMRKGEYLLGIDPFLSRFSGSGCVHSVQPIINSKCGSGRVPFAYAQQLQIGMVLLAASE